jgi:plasmid stabilization system protein ParE
VIARRTDAPARARLELTLDARRSLTELMRYIASKPGGDAKARRADIMRAIQSLREAPLRCEVFGVKKGFEYRRLIVNARFFVYYIYQPPRTLSSAGTLSIRAVKHASMSRPFFGVRDSPTYGTPPSPTVGG